VEAFVGAICLEGKECCKGRKEEEENMKRRGIANISWIAFPAGMAEI